MMDANTAGGARRGRKRRGRGGPPSSPSGAETRGLDARRRKKRKKPRSNSHGERATIRHSGLEPVKDNGSVLGRRVPQRREREATNGPPDAFALFCAYHLGVTSDDGYQKPSLDGTARRYGLPPDEIKGLLQQYDLDPESIARTDFDLEGAKLDVRLAPEGMSRTEIARDHFESYLACLGD